MEVDVSTLPVGLTISAFFNGFLQEIHDQAPELLALAKSIKWRTKFDFQKENIQRWMTDFTPIIR
jgi:hypothetical protein